MHHAKPITKSDLELLISWLETKDGNYNANDCVSCLLGQYLRVCYPGQRVSIGSNAAWVDENSFEIPTEMQRVVAYDRNDFGHSQLRTFSSALYRAKCELERLELQS